MPKRRRLFTPMKNRTSKPQHNRDSSDAREPHHIAEVATARGRLKGALMEVLDPAGDESDASSDYVPDKRDSQSQETEKSEDEERPYRRKWSPHRQSYVLKLFDRSVDLSQFTEESPLYPICRAWIANQPRANYSEFGKSEPELDLQSETLELPGPEGPHVSKIPPLLPEQLKANKNNINLNYREAPPPSREQLLASHSVRWTAVRQAWLEQAAKVEARYETTQQILNKINVNAL
ncbi:protein lin-37 homolog isoform X1 [Helicoverpa zea]|uniref:protein lin-37 homolog isoform X1 n=1 Tax=Helicoverpa zea TaxID=7113 RepID=UPI001F5971E4|nr:protein lin-37 homolog isoform X1 [Helicoverpa zea]